jgi:hypothetical protein
VLGPGAHEATAAPAAVVDALAPTANVPAAAATGVRGPAAASRVPTAGWAAPASGNLLQHLQLGQVRIWGGVVLLKTPQGHHSTCP